MNPLAPAVQDPDPSVLGAPRLPGVGTTIFTHMSALASEHGAVNLGQGFPDFDAEAGLLHTAGAALLGGHNQYAPMAGDPGLRAQVAALASRSQGARYDPASDITITAGATQALLTAILALVGPGDEVVVLEPAYDSYAPAVALAGARLVPVALDPQRGFRPDWDRVRAALSPRTRMLVLNFPHNPSGAVLDESDLDALETLARLQPFLILSDEVYEHLVFDGQRHCSPAARPSLARRTLVTTSFGKTLHVTGWKLGACLAPATLTARFRAVHQFNVFAVNHPLQKALATHLQAHPDLGAPAAFYQARRDHFLAGLARTRLRALPCHATYFVLVDYRAVSALDDLAFCEHLVRQHGVAAIPLSVFHREPVQHGVIRLCFAKRFETLDAALEKLQKL
jgi:methionine aminotransferase